jgi:hypothetical protein
MPSIDMQCPSGGKVLVSGGTICVRGRYLTTFSLWAKLKAIFKALLRFLRWIFGLGPVQTHNGVTPPTIMAAVGKSGDPPPAPGTGLLATISGQAWCARGVPVPAGTQPGTALVAYAWLNPTTGALPDCKSSFTASLTAGTGVSDCCSSCVAP